LLWIQANSELASEMTSMHANQTLLHQKLKDYYSEREGGQQEAILEIKGKNYRIDLLNKERNTAYEIQLTNFGKQFSAKISALLTQLNVIIVHPLAVKETVTWLNQGKVVSTRTIRKRTDIYSLFDKLVSFNTLFIPDKLGFDILFTEEEVWKDFIGFRGRSKRPRYRQVQRDLIAIQEATMFRTVSDFTGLLPEALPTAFTNRELMESLAIQGGERRKRRIAGRLTYSLCNMGVLKRIGMRGRAYEFEIQDF
jgi:hypothetical protein